MGDLLGNLVFFLLLLLCKEEGIFWIIYYHLLSFITFHFLFFFCLVRWYNFCEYFLKFIFDEYYLNELDWPFTGIKTMKFRIILEELLESKLKLNYLMDRSSWIGKN